MGEVKRKCEEGERSEKWERKDGGGKKMLFLD